jgi:hypothetical protein
MFSEILPERLWQEVHEASGQSSQRHHVRWLGLAWLCKSCLINGTLQSTYDHMVIKISKGYKVDAHEMIAKSAVCKVFSRACSSKDIHTHSVCFFQFIKTSHLTTRRSHKA